MNTRLWSAPISDQAHATASAAVTAEALSGQTREQILCREPRLQAWVALSPDIDAQARAVDHTSSRLPLRGISLGVKDLIDVRGLPTRAGSPVTADDAVAADADCVARIRALGAVVQGKTVTTEFGYFSPGPTRNPHALSHTPGGSSSGSAAAVGAGTIPLALGTQTAGSLTRPASFCGTAGMVLAHGAADMTGIAGLSASLDSLGLLTRTVDDLRSVYRAFLDIPDGDIPGGAAPDINTVHVWYGSHLGDVAAPMCRLLHQLPPLIDSLGLDCRPLDWDEHVHALATDHATVMAHEAATARATELSRHSDMLSEPLRLLLQQGAQISGSDYRAALARRDRSADLLADTLGPTSLVIGPAALGPAPAGLAATGSPILSRPWQLLGLPVVVVPGARTATGLPLGVQIIGLPGREAAMLELGVALEALLRALPPIPERTDEEPC